MPLARKKRKVVLSEKVGKHREYLTEHFSLLPERLEELKHGHVLFQHTVHETLVKRTIDAITEKLPCVILPAQINSVLNEVKKFKNLSRPKDMERYQTLCSKAYTLFEHAPCTTETSKGQYLCL